MSRDEEKPSALARTAFQRAEVDALKRMLAISQGTFSLSVAVCNSPALRDHLISHIQDEVPAIKVVRLSEATSDVLAAARQQVPDADPYGLFLVNVDKAIKGDREDEVLQMLNASRESWRTHYPCPVVFWVPEYVAQLLSSRARDLWSWISHSFEFVSEQATAQAGLQDHWAGDLTQASNLDVHEKHLRIAELEQRIRDVGERPTGLLRNHALIWLNELAYLYRGVGKLDKAEQTYRKCLKQMEPENIADKAIAYGNLGLVYEMRGDFDEAEKTLRKALEIFKKLGRLESMAIQYANLGPIYRRRGNLDEAEKNLRKALEIFERLGRLESVATTYGNLGLIYQTHGDLDEAEKMLKKSLEIFEKRGRLEGMANQYGNLGSVHFTRGNLDEAEKSIRKSLEIDEKLGQLEGMGNQYGNLGLICKERGEIAKAREHWTKASGLFEKIGMPHMVAKVQSCIDGLGDGKE